MKDLFCPCLVLIYDSKFYSGEVILKLAEVGEKIPWADWDGKVVFGPPISGVHPDNLQWEVSQFFAFEVSDPEGNPVELPPEEYLSAMRMAEDIMRD